MERKGKEGAFVESFVKKLRLRIYVSAVCLALFIVLGAAQAGQWIVGISPYIVTAFMLAGYFLLPRHTLPPGFAQKQTSEQDAELVMRMNALQKRLVYARLGYFLIAVIVLLGFPRIF